MKAKRFTFAIWSIDNIVLFTPRVEQVVVYFCNEQTIEKLQSGIVPTSIAAHESVLSHYNVSSVFLAQEVARRMTRGSLTWEEYGGTHPAPAGNAIVAGLCGDLLETAWARESRGFDAVSPHRIPPTLMDDGSYVHGRWLSPEVGGNQPGEDEDSNSSSCWVFEVPDYEGIDGGFRDTFAGLPLLCGATPGAGAVSHQTAKISFEGNMFGAFVLAGPDAGVVECSVDAGEWTVVDLYHHFSGGLHYPRTVIFAEGLGDGRHQAVLWAAAGEVERRGRRQLCPAAAICSQQIDTPSGGT